MSTVPPIPFKISSKFKPITDRFFPFNNPGPLAEPWRRLLAATIDSSILLTIGVIAWLFLILKGIGADRGQLLFCAFAPFICWFYVLIGWSIGATPGMAILNIRIVRDQANPEKASRPGFKTALIRIVGYWIGSIPMKGGLVPILSHPRRQAWHDQIARTIVIKSGRQVPPPVDEEDVDIRAESMPPNFEACGKGWLIPLLLYFLIAVVFTYPLVRHFTTELAGCKGDSSLFVWDYWYLSQALAGHKPLLQTNLLFYPQTVSTIYHTMDWFNGVLAIPLLPTIGTIATYNTLLLTSLTLSAFFTYLLLVALSSHRLASAVIAPVFGLSPFFMAHALGHANLISAEFLPLFALFSYAALNTLKVRYALYAGIAFGLGGLCDYQFMVFDAILLGGLVAGFIWRPLKLNRTLLMRKTFLALVILVVGSAIMSPFLFTLIGFSHAHSYMDQAGEAAGFSADLNLYFRPSFLSTVSRNAATFQNELINPSVEDVYTPGLAILALAGLAVLTQRKKLFAWYSALIGSLVLSCGPVLWISNCSLPSFFVLCVGGFPGCDALNPFDFSSFSRFALAVAASPDSLISDESGYTMPFRLLQLILAPLRTFRAPARIAEVVLLCVGVFATFGLIQLMAWLEKRWGKAAAVLITMLSFSLILLQYYSAPYPLWKPYDSGFYSYLANKQDNSPVINIPLSPYEVYAYDQAQHHHPVYAGFLSRTPSDAYDEIDRNVFLQFCATSGRRMPILNQSPDASPDQLKTALQQLSDQGAQYILIHKKQMSAHSFENYDLYLSRVLRLHEVWDDHVIRVYAVPSNVAPHQSNSILPGNAKLQLESRQAPTNVRIRSALIPPAQLK